MVLIGKFLGNEITSAKQEQLIGLYARLKLVFRGFSDEQQDESNSTRMNPLKNHTGKIVVYKVQDLELY